jgi:hypothetical protein
LFYYFTPQYSALSKYLPAGIKKLPCNFLVYTSILKTFEMPSCIETPYTMFEDSEINES